MGHDSACATACTGGAEWMEDAHVKTVEEVLAFHKTSLRKGLTAAEAESRLARFGRNELAHKEGRSIFALIAEQFQDLLVRILLAAAAVSFTLAIVDGGDEGLAAYVEPLVILVILVLNAAVGVWQESNAEKALEALKELQPLQARVCRDGKWKVLVSAELVPGDIVDLRCGDKVPADCRLAELASTSIRLEESQLTGESVAVLKECEPLPLSLKDAELQCQRCMVFSSTSVVSGHALAVVVKTGMQTQIGKIQAAVQEADETEDARSPLHLKLEEFGETLSKVIFAICGIVWLINIGHFSDPVHGGVFRGCIYYFKIAVALAVAAIPEGLPAVITTCLALGTRKMASKNAIVRKLQSVETLGCTTVICSDKTGTLTTNEMTASCFGVVTAEGQLRKFLVEGSKFSPVGRVFCEGQSGAFRGIAHSDSILQYFSGCCVTCNEAKLDMDGRSSSQAYTRMGEPTEAALLVLSEKLGVPDARLNDHFLNTEARSSDAATPFCDFWRQRFHPLATLEFSRDRKRMSVLARDVSTQSNVLFVKGAPESVLERCVRLIGSDAPLTQADVSLAEKYVEELQSRGLRTLALAARLDCGILSDFDPNAPGAASHPAHSLLQNASNFSQLESDLCLIGFVGVTDPPRPEVGDAITKCKKAGVRVIMITGDSVKTAEVIAKAVNIHEGTEQNFPVLTGKEFEAMNETQRRESLSHPGGAVFARTEPKHKQMIVKLLRAMGETTAMTGDGVNDAPALKQADIGVAMGLAGTEVAKEASDMILADDNFSTIVSAVEEGRSIYNNMKAFIRYLISSNIGEVASIFLTAAMGIPEGLTPVQLLWVNLVTDGPPATALGFNPADRDVMERPPRHREDSLISSWIFLRYLVIGVYVGIATVGVFVCWFVFGTDPSEAHTLVSLRELMSWGRCSSWNDFTPTPVYGMRPDDPCSYFTVGKAKASTLSLTVLVVIEMFNAFNALSENQSLLRMPPWANPYLIIATFSSVLVHCSILYIPFLSQIFGVVPLTVADWMVVLAWSLPVVFIDELLKFIGKKIIFRLSNTGRRMQTRKTAESPLAKKLK